MSRTTLIKNAVVVTPEGENKSSVLLRDGKIAALDVALQTVADEVINAAGLHLLPGVIDDQVHFREPGLTHKEDLAHATRAAAKGGVTSFLEMPNTVPTTTTCERLAQKLEIAAQSCLVNYGFYMGATCDNIAELKQATRTPGIKIFIGSSTGDLLVDDQAALERIFAETTLPICAHCEDEATVRANQARLSGRTDVAAHTEVRDYAAALIATKRAIDLARRHGHQFHILHVSTADELPEIKAAPPWVTAEVCLHHLFFSVEDYARLGSLIKMNPSIKYRRDNEALWAALLDGTITVVATDHAPHTLEEKAQPYPACPSGLPAVENSLALMLDQVNRGRCTLPQVVKWMSAEPARIWYLSGKGRIEVGADADLVLVDMQLKQTIVNELQETKSRWSPWAGETLQGWPIRTWVNGQEVFRLVEGRPQFDLGVRGQELRFDERRPSLCRYTS
ncbi:MAG: dihydroorotase [Planctomycetota bacterium]|jgi:dihydroorotase